MMLTLLALSAGCKKQPPAAAAAPQPIACYRPAGMFGPVELFDSDVRYGEGEHALAELVTSAKQPVEVCAVSGQLDWLLAARCADGSAPFTEPSVAHSARVGNVGQGGRCDSVIDLYAVACPEGSYEVYMDLYMCRPGESL
jgi:hypothetical protein